MVKPCSNCLIKMCCSTPCIEYAEYILSNEQYPETIGSHIKGMSHGDAIAYILQVETVWFYFERTGE